MIAALLALLVTAGADEADDAATCVRTKAWEAYADGWSLRSLVGRPLALGGRHAVAVTLYPGRTYRFVGCAAGGVSDLDLALYDGAGKIVRTDATTDAQPVLDATGLSGTFTLVIYARRATSPGAGAVAVLHR